MALNGNGTGRTFLSVFSQTKRRAQLRESKYGIMISQAKVGFNLQLLTAFFDDPRRITVLKTVESVARSNIASEARSLACTVEANALDVPLFLERFRDEKEHYLSREIVYVDSETILPVLFEGVPIVEGYNPTAC